MSVDDATPGMQTPTNPLLINAYRWAEQVLNDGIDGTLQALQDAAFDEEAAKVKQVFDTLDQLRFAYLTLAARAVASESALALLDLVDGGGSVVQNEVHVNDFDYDRDGSVTLACGICRDPANHDGQPHGQATGDGLSRYDIVAMLDDRGLLPLHEQEPS